MARCLYCLRNGSQYQGHFGLSKTLSFSHLFLSSDDLGTCQPGWKERPGTDTCYYISDNTDKKTWEEGMLTCRRQQGDTVIIDSLQEKVCCSYVWCLFWGSVWSILAEDTRICIREWLDDRSHRTRQHRGSNPGAVYTLPAEPTDQPALKYLPRK